MEPVSQRNTIKSPFATKPSETTTSDKHAPFPQDTYETSPDDGNFKEKLLAIPLIPIAAIGFLLGAGCERSKKTKEGGKEKPDSGTTTPKNTAMCGNGVLERGESCEPGGELDGLPCPQIDTRFIGGVVACTPTCNISTASCITRTNSEPQPNRPSSPDAGTVENPPTSPTPPATAVCGNGVLERGEACERTLFPAELACSRIDPRYISGMIYCNDDCEFSLTNCVLSGVCGNGVLDLGETCDDANMQDRDGCSSNCFYEGPPTAEQPFLCGTTDRTFLGMPLGEIDLFCDNPDNRDTYTPFQTKLLRLQIHTVRSMDGVLSATPLAVESMVASAQTYFRPAKIDLTWNGTNTVDVIDDPNNIYFNLGFANYSNLINTNPSSSAVDVYLVNTFASLCGRATDIGLSSWGDAVVVATGCGGSTLAHELGHQLGLWHTHHETPGIPNTVSCNSREDYCCDTPHDPGPPWAANEGDGTCSNVFAPQCTPFCPDGSTPDGCNVLSYYSAADNPDFGHFSTNQISRMLCYLDRQYDYASPCNEGGQAQCSTTIGECEVGTRTCHNNSWGACVNGVEPQREICDRRDNDCDGLTDEGVNPLTEPVVNRCSTDGVCANDRARNVCRDGQWVCDYPPNYVANECRVVQTGCGHGSLNDSSCRDRIDNDCDGVTDENNPYTACSQHPDYPKVQRGEICFASPHGICGQDGGTYECVQLAGGCGINVDCSGATFPQNEECNANVDKDCDGHNGNRNDIDKDGFGDCPGRTDCNETNRAIYPGAVELCDRLDNNCNNATDEEGALGCNPYYLDADRDGFGVGASRCLCGPEGNYSALLTGDCNDNNPRQYPRNAEICDSIDNDCDNVVDEEGASDCRHYYLDADRDGYGTDSSLCLCSPQGNYRAITSGDCADNDPTRSPGRVEVCDAVDNNCNRSVDESFNFNTDANNCGGCGNTCSATSCVNGHCDVQGIALGAYFSCALMTNRTVYCWGINSYGQLGDGTITDHSLPAPVLRLSNVAQIALGTEHACALLVDGAVKCWGRNFSGQLGDGTRTDRHTPVSVIGLANPVRQIDLGWHHSCAVLVNNDIQCWGNNSYGQLGDGTRTTRHTPVAVSGLHCATEVALGVDHSCARCGESYARCWGFNAYGQMGEGGLRSLYTSPAADVGIPQPLTGITQIDAGAHHNCALLNTGDISCWGNNNYGQVGYDTNNRLRPTLLSFAVDRSQIALGGWHSCTLGVGPQRSISCWGNNGRGQLGLGHTTDVHYPTVLNYFPGVIQIGAGWSHSCLLLATGDVRCWGGNGSGQLGDGTDTDRYVPTPVLWP